MVVEIALPVDQSHRLYRLALPALAVCHYWMDCALKVVPVSSATTFLR
jgi:hypothetical protein